MGKRLLIIFDILFVLLFFTNYLADVYFYFGKADNNIDLINTAITINPYEPSYYINRAKLKVLNSATNSAMFDLARAYNLNPHNLATIRNSLPVYAASDATFTSEYLDMLKQRYSTDVGVLVEVAEYEYLLGFTDSYNQTREMIKNLRPDLLEWHDVLTN